MRIKHALAVTVAFTGLGCAPATQMTEAQVPQSPVVKAPVAATPKAPTAPALTVSRPPSVPLISHDPYFSLWSNSDQLTDSATTHWTGRTQAMSSLLRLDGRTYRLMGDTPASVPALTQSSVQVTPTRSVYSFTGGGVKVRLTFTAPLLPQDLDLTSRPLSYISWDVTSIDNATHDASIYFDASSALTVNEASQPVVWKREKAGDLTALRIGSQDQPVLAKTGDDLRIDWGYLYLAAPSKSAGFALGDNAALETGFAARGTLPAADDTRQPRAVEKGEPVAALAFALGKVGNRSVSRMAMLAYDDIYSIQYMGHNLRPYWRRSGANALTLLQTGARDYNAILARCVAFDAELMADMTKVGGAKYAQLGALAYRQALAAQKIVADSNGQPLSFAKENNSNGCIATVDVMYPASPQMMALSPSLLKATLQPIMAYGSSGYWKWPFAPHDLGTYPKANGQVYGGGERTEDGQMPVEETGNLLIMLGALSKMEGNTKFSDQFWPAITKWAAYLADKGFDPESQLSTDDFAGHLAHNVNLSAKAIVALGAYAQMAQMHGEVASATKYRGLAEKFAAQWVKEATEGDFTRLAFDKPGTWSQKYNLAWDGILGLNLFPASFYTKEMAFYKTKMNAYGLPLDSRRDYTKIDWETWTATLTGRRDDFESIINPIYDWMNTTPNRVPLSDWYDTKTARQEGFKARSVVGGLFIPLLRDGAIWKKNVSRDTHRYANWAPMPARPSFREIVPTGSSQAGLNWKYILEKPTNPNWYAAGFNDAAWKTGEAGFGSNGTPGIIVRTPWTGSDIWLRRSFTFAGTPPTSAQLYGLHDDEVEVYLNGRLVISLGGYNAGYEQLAPIPAGLLKSGENVLAVHCHQDGGGQGVDIGVAVQVSGNAAAPKQ